MTTEKAIPTLPFINTGMGERNRTAPVAYEEKTTMRGGDRSVYTAIGAPGMDGRVLGFKTGGDKGKPSKIRIPVGQGHFMVRVVKDNKTRKIVESVVYRLESLKDVLETDHEGKFTLSAKGTWRPVMSATGGEVEIIDERAVENGWVRGELLNLVASLQEHALGSGWRSASAGAGLSQTSINCASPEEGIGSRADRKVFNQWRAIGVAFREFVKTYPTLAGYMEEAAVFLSDNEARNKEFAERIAEAKTGKENEAPLQTDKTTGNPPLEKLPEPPRGLVINEDGTSASITAGGRGLTTAALADWIAALAKVSDINNDRVESKKLEAALEYWDKISATLAKAEAEGKQIDVAIENKPGKWPFLRITATATVTPPGKPSETQTLVLSDWVTKEKQNPSDANIVALSGLVAKAGPKAKERKAAHKPKTAAAAPSEEVAAEETGGMKI